MLYDDCCIPYRILIVKRYGSLCGLLLMAVFPLCAQNWTKADSLRLEQLLQTDGEIQLNLDLLKEAESPWGIPKSMESKPWWK